MKKVSSKKKYRCSDGEMVSQAQINSRLKKAYEEIEMLCPTGICQAYNHMKADDHDHTISQKRCKELGKTELIWDIDNIEFSCREAHMEWESYKSGYFEDHANVIKRMLYVKKHDTEGFEKRMIHMNNYKIMKTLRS